MSGAVCIFNSSSLRFIRQLFGGSLSGLRFPTSWTEVNYTRLGIPEDSQLLQIYLALGKHDMWQSSPTLPPSEWYQTVWEGSQEDCSLQKPPYSSTWDSDNIEWPTSRFHRAEMILEKMQNLYWMTVWDRRSSPFKSWMKKWTCLPLEIDIASAQCSPGEVHWFYRESTTISAHSEEKKRTTRTVMRQQHQETGEHSLRQKKDKMRDTSWNIEQMARNLSDWEHTEPEEDVWAIGLNFAITPQRLPIKTCICATRNIV